MTELRGGICHHRTSTPYKSGNKKRKDQFLKLSHNVSTYQLEALVKRMEESTV